MALKKSSIIWISVLKSREHQIFVLNNTFFFLLSVWYEEKQSSKLWPN